jgi:hypothetical protein
MTCRTHWRWNIKRVQFREAVGFNFLLAISFYILAISGFN